MTSIETADMEDVIKVKTRMIFPNPGNVEFPKIVRFIGSRRRRVGIDFDTEKHLIFGGTDDFPKLESEELTEMFAVAVGVGSEGYDEA